MKGSTASTPGIRLHGVGFPWPSALGGLVVVAYVLFMTEPALTAYYGIPDAWLRPGVKYAVLAAFVLLVLLDLRRYRRQRTRQQAQLRDLRRQVDDLWERNRQLQLKAHTYSGQTEKLKRFVSDKLLDYIEYDEKFLHFKSIAAEVRHNGVISFDKVQTALQQAAATAEDAPASPSPSPAAEAVDYREALAAMRYLWDLLDLSTADNLALHIGNLLCDCEEQYCQRLLADETAAPLPYEPVYPPRRAIWRALEMVRHEALPMPDDEADYTFDDRQWHIHLAPVDPLLGNENHLVLLAENLLRNAQFFSRKRGYRTPAAPLAVTLTEEKGHACLRVYNRGPHIRDEDRAGLFQLGYSTRRAREHHGRGLGLYFVNEIVKGYEGRIAADNVHTPETRYTVTLEQDSGKVITEPVDVVVDDDGVRCRAVDGDIAETRTWSLGSALRRVEIAVADGSVPPCVMTFADKGKQVRFDPGHPARPHWRLAYHPRRNAHRLELEPLDIGGVEFAIHLPTARQRLDSGDGIDAGMEQPDEPMVVRAIPGPE